MPIVFTVHHTRWQRCLRTLKSIAKFPLVKYPALAILVVAETALVLLTMLGLALHYLLIRAITWLLAKQ
ncbi:MAG: hypothetical protein M1503_11545 [Thaumarchaeota archaeon]|nr:hypothetical protein [Nitrososphaerota archaeon]